MLQELGGQPPPWARATFAARLGMWSTATGQVDAPVASCALSDVAPILGAVISPHKACPRCAASAATLA
eukprot:1609366-Alexandrium_andersonii.AAC.1